MSCRRITSGLHLHRCGSHTTWSRIWPSRTCLCTHPHTGAIKVDLAQPVVIIATWLCKISLTARMMSMGRQTEHRAFIFKTSRLIRQLLHPAKMLIQTCNGRLAHPLTPARTSTGGATRQTGSPNSTLSRSQRPARTTKTWTMPSLFILAALKSWVDAPLQSRWVSTSTGPLEPQKLLRCVSLIWILITFSAFRNNS